jgi:hypothetical protein
MYTNSIFVKWPLRAEIRQGAINSSPAQNQGKPGAKPRQ